MDRRALLILRAVLGLAVALTMGLGLNPAITGQAAGGAPTFSPESKVDAYGGGTEPRVTVAPNGKRYIASNQPDNTAEIYQSIDGLAWHKTAGTLPGQNLPTIDVDIVAMHTGRLLATELDTQALSFISAYSDDEGATWTASQFTALADQDRQWFAVGPDDATTHQPRVYLLFHNLASGNVSHNMFVSTSTDGGATFGPPVPTTLPGSQAYADLQCADSGGPSNIMVNQKTGQVYAVFGTRSSPLAGGVANPGGCGASATGTPQFNIVAATKIWVATSPDGSIGSWTQSAAVDNSANQKIVGMQLNVGTIDTAGNVYVTYPESPRGFPDYSQAAVKMSWAHGDLAHWSTPVTVVFGGDVGHMLVHSIAGAPGGLNLAYFTGVARGGKGPLWYLDVAQTLNALDANPTFTVTRVSTLPTYTLTPAQMMGACTASGIVNGLACNRSTDVWGVALDNSCHLVVTWPVSGDTTQNDVSASAGGTYATTQQGGPTVCADAFVTATAAPSALSSALPDTSRPGSTLVPVLAVAALLLVALGVGWTLRSRRVS